MKTLEDFKLIVPILAKRLEGKVGGDFHAEIIAFMEDYEFEQIVIRNLYEQKGVGVVIHITDNMKNSDGILILDLYNEEKHIVCNACSETVGETLVNVCAYGLKEYMYHLKGLYDLDI